MRIAVYARYSSEKQSEGYSIEAQIESCRVFIRNRGSTLSVSEYIDRAKSGSTIAGHTELMRLIGDAARGEIAEIVVHKFDRLGRNQAECATLIQDLEETGTKVLSATEGDDPLARGMHLVFAEHYNRQLAERTRAGCMKAAQNGRIGGPTPYGYSRTADGEFAIDPNTSSVVQRIFTEYTQHHKSYKAIVRALNAEGIPSPRGGEWHAPTILEIMRNEIYVGRVIFNRRRFRRDRRSGRRIYTRNPKSEWLTIDHPELAIISPETFAAAHHRRAQRKPGSAGVRHTYPLSGVVECADCGSAYVAQKSKNKKGEYVYMACGGRASGGKCENNFRFRQDIVMPEITAQLSEALFTPESEAALKRSIARLAVEQLQQGETENQEIQERIETTRKRISAIIDLMAEAKERGDATDSLFLDELRKKQGNLAALQARSEELETGPRLDIAHLNRVIESVIERQKNGLLEIKDPESIRKALRVLVGQLIAHPDGTITYSTKPVNLLQADGSCIALVAGAGFEPATFGL